MRLLDLKTSRGGFYAWIKKVGIPVKKVKAIHHLRRELNAAWRCFKLGDEIGFFTRSGVSENWLQGTGADGQEAGGGKKPQWRTAAKRKKEEKHHYYAFF